MFLFAMDELTLQWIAKVARNAYWDRLSSYSDSVYILCFITASLLMIGGCLLPRTAQPPSTLARIARMRGAFIQGGAAILFILLLISQQITVDHSRGFVADQNKRHEAKIRAMKKDSDAAAILQAEYLYVPQGNSLAYMSLGNTSIAADYMWLTSLQYVTSSFRRGQKFQMLTRFYENVLDLDPHWTEAQINAGRVLSALEPDRFAVEKFYMRALQKNPDSWRLTFEAGRLFIVAPPSKKLRKEYAAHASHWFQRTLDKLKRLPDSSTNPTIVANIRQSEIFLSQMSLDSGQLEASDKMLWEIAIDKEMPKAMRWAATQDWLTARSLLVESKLKEQVDRIKAQTGQFPPTLEPAFLALKDDPRVQPYDPFGFRYVYNPTNGMVRSQGVLARMTLQASAIVEALVAGYAGEFGDAPKDMKVFQKWVTARYLPPNEPAPPAVTDYIGDELNVVTTPLGGPWIVNAATGTVELPIGLDPKLAISAARKFFPDLFE